MRTVVVTQYKKLEYLPPVMALLQALKSLQVRVVFVGVPSEAGESFLKGLGIEYHLMPNFHDRLYHSTNGLSKITNRLERLYWFIPHRMWMRRKLLQIEGEHGEFLLWNVEVLSAALLGNWAGRFKRRLLSIYELGDIAGRNWFGFSLSRCLKSARLVVPEYNRAIILKGHFGLSYTPFVIPNKPFSHPRTRNLPLPDGAIADAFDKIGDRPVFLYQGVWSADRRDVAKILETIAKNRPQYCVVSMPDCPAVKELAKKYDNVFGLPFVAPPQHLNVTSHATVGIAVYNSSGRTTLERLNALYCAPNKIYEYAGFGIPTLGNDIPGLRYTIEQNAAGVCCDPQDEPSILSTADKLVNEQESYARNAAAFYDATNLEGAVLKSVEKWFRVGR